MGNEDTNNAKLIDRLLEDPKILCLEKGPKKLRLVIQDPEIVAESMVRKAGSRAQTIATITWLGLGLVLSFQALTYEMPAPLTWFVTALAAGCYLAALSKGTSPYANPESKSLASFVYRAIYGTDYKTETWIKAHIAGMVTKHKAEVILKEAEVNGEFKDYDRVTLYIEGGETVFEYKATQEAEVTPVEAEVTLKC